MLTNPDIIYNTYKDTSINRLLTSINRTNNTTLTEDDVVLTTPIHNLGETNTKITVIALPDSSYTGRFDWYYNRVYISKIFGDNYPTLQLTQDIFTVTDLLDEIDRRYRIRLTHDDVINDNIPRYDTPGYFNIRMKDSSLGWLGTLRIKLVPVQDTLSTIITQNIDDSINQGEHIDGRTRSEIFYGFKRLTDLSHYPNLLTNNVIAKGDLVSNGWMVDIVKSLFSDKWHWTIGETSDFNLYGSMITYFNANEGQMYLDGDIRDITLAIRLGKNCKNMSGYLLIKLPWFYIDHYYRLIEEEDGDATTDPSENNEGSSTNYTENNENTGQETGTESTTVETTTGGSETTTEGGI